MSFYNFVIVEVIYCHMIKNWYFVYQTNIDINENILMHITLVNIYVHGYMYITTYTMGATFMGFQDK